MGNTKKKVATPVATNYFDSLPSRYLTAHFRLREFVVSATAIKYHLDNMPPDDAERRLKALCENVLEPLRRRFGVIRITSGYRSPRVNALVGGAATSQHMRGEAADINVSSAEAGQKMYDFIRNSLPFDQLIMEHRYKTGSRWIHVSYTADRPCRHEAFTIEKR